MNQWFEHITDGDTISRQAAIDALTEYWHGIQDRHQTLDSEMAVYADCKSIIKRLPSAQRKGKWVATQEWGGRNYSCSCCKFSFMVDTCMLEPMWNFCPNCGAEMKGEEDETD